MNGFDLQKTLNTVTQSDTNRNISEVEIYCKELSDLELCREALYISKAYFDLLEKYGHNRHKRTRILRNKLDILETEKQRRGLYLFNKVALLNEIINRE